MFNTCFLRCEAETDDAVIRSPTALACETERRQSACQEEERKREEEAKRQAATERRWREEQGRVERLERLAKVWRRNQELRRLLVEIQAAIGDVAPDSELGQWLAWATDHIDSSDPLRHLRGRQSRTLTVYYHGWDRDYLQERGFHDPKQPTYGGAEKVKMGVELTCQPPRRTLYVVERAPRIDLPEDFLLPYEWPQETDWLYSCSACRRCC
jgi:hypothetical protein